MAPGRQGPLRRWCDGCRPRRQMFSLLAAAANVAARVEDLDAAQRITDLRAALALADFDRRR